SQGLMNDRKEKSHDSSVAQRKAFASRLVSESQAIRGTLAEKYLREHRGIDLHQWPDSIRFHPGIYSGVNRQTLPALLVIARDDRGQIQAVQATWLDP